jgi:hypothetical protein
VILGSVLAQEAEFESGEVMNEELIFAAATGSAVVSLGRFEIESDGTIR